MYVQRFAKLFVGPALSPKAWVDALSVLFPEAQRRYAEAAALGRDFYDAARGLARPDLKRNDRFLSELDFKQFVKNMEPARKGMSQADSPKAAVTNMTLAATREVEMAGRRQIIGAVKNDDELNKSVEDQPVDSQRAVGWARVATGRETCSWCLMLISRGPKYYGADTGGINLDDETVIDLYKEAGGDLLKFRQATEEYVEEWHAGCDCLVVPVFDRKNWPGKAASERATQLWIDAGKEARTLIESGKARSNNENQETINALRRRLYHGEVSMSDYAFAA